MAQNLKSWILIAGLALGLLTLYQLLPILTPFLVSILLAYMGDPIVDFLERYNISRTFGVVLVFVFLSVVLLILLLVLVPMIGRQLVKLYELTPQLIDWLQDSALPWLQMQLRVNAGISGLDNIKQMFTEQFLYSIGSEMPKMSGNVICSPIALILLSIMRVVVWECKNHNSIGF